MSDVFIRGNDLLCKKHRRATYAVHAQCPLCVGEDRQSQIVEMIKLQKRVEELERRLKLYSFASSYPRFEGSVDRS